MGTRVSKTGFLTKRFHLNLIADC